MNYIDFHNIFYRNQYKAIDLARKHVSIGDKKFLAVLLDWLSPGIKYDQAIKKDMSNFYMIQKAAAMGVTLSLVI